MSKKDPIPFTPPAYLELRSAADQLEYERRLEAAQRRAPALKRAARTTPYPPVRRPKS